MPRTSLSLATCSFNALVQQGIEPNPGPRRHGKTRLLSRGFSLWSLNTGGAPKVWDFLKLVHSNGVSLAVVQEARMKQNELDAFSGAAWKQGYKLFSVRGPVSLGRTGLERDSGGVLVLVKRGLPHRTCLQISQPGGQASAVWVGGILLVGIYCPPNEHQASFLVSLNESLAEFYRFPCLIVGDWNLTPSENSFIDATGASVLAARAVEHESHADRGQRPLNTQDDAASLDCFAAEPAMDLGRVEPQIHDAHPDMDDSLWLPTRWGGNRCVDYALSTSMSISASAQLGEEKLSDHKILKLQFDKNLPESESVKLRKCDSYPIPEGLLLDEWRALISAAWTEQQWTPPALLCTQASIDAVWDSFSDALECAFRTARARAKGLEPKPLPKSFRPRNCPPRFVRPKACAKKHPEAFLPPLNLRQSHNRGNHTSNGESPIEFISKEQQLRKWRDRMLACDKDVFKWLRGHSGAPTYNIFWAQSPVANSPLEGIQCLKTFWKTIWGREVPDFDTIFDAIGEILLKSGIRSLPRSLLMPLKHLGVLVLV